MARKERFGRFVLLEEVEASGLGPEFRAAKLSPTGLEKIVSLVRLKPALGTAGEAVRSLMDQIKFAAHVHNPSIIKIFGIGKIDSSYYVSSEFLEGKSLKAVLNRTRLDAFPFSVDHALLIASKACAALEDAQGRKTADGSRYFHGLITPWSVVLSYEGDVKVRGFGVWPSRIREAGGTLPEEEAYLSPEQVAGGFGDVRSDIWTVGALLFETLTGEPYVLEGRRENPAVRLSKVHLQGLASQDDVVPKPLSDILNRALAVDAAARYAEVQEMRKAVDTLLFSGDFTPTTFNLAFFMHSVFREDIDREARVLKEEKEASYIEFLTEDTPRPSPPAPAVVAPAASAAMAPAISAVAAPVEPAAPPVTETPIAPRPAKSPAPAPSAARPLPLVPPPVGPIRPSGPVRTAPVPDPRVAVSAQDTDEVREGASRPDAAAGLTAREATAGFTFHREEAAGRRKGPLVAVGLAALLLIGAGAGYIAVRPRPAAVVAAPAPVPPPPTTLGEEAAAALARVKELEDKLKALEVGRQAAAARAAEEAASRVRAQAAARGQTVDPTAVARAQEEARRRAQAEQERRLREEQERLEAEQHAAEVRLADERRREEEARAATALAANAAPPATATIPPPAPSTPPPVAPATEPPASALRPGTLVNLSDAGVIAPVVDRAAPAVYPPIALRQRVEGTVELNVLVDERGNVVDAKVVSGAGGKAGLNEAAIESVRRRKYRPALKDGVAVKVWVPVRVLFRLP